MPVKEYTIEGNHPIFSRYDKIVFTEGDASRIKKELERLGYEVSIKIRDLI